MASDNANWKFTTASRVDRKKIFKNIIIGKLKLTRYDFTFKTIAIDVRIIGLSSKYFLKYLEIRNISFKTHVFELKSLTCIPRSLLSLEHNNLYYVI